MSVIIMKYNKKISISLTPEQFKQVELLSVESCRSKSGYIRQLIKIYLQYIGQHPSAKLK